MDRVVQVVEATRSGSLYHLGDGFFFTVISSSATVTYLRCNKHRYGCPAKAVMNHQGFSTYYEHTHEADMLQVPILTERRKILNRAANIQQYATLSEVFDNERNIFPDLLNRRTLMPAMTRARLNTLPPPPLTLQLLHHILVDPLFKCLSATTGFQDSIYGGSTEASDGSRVILFISAQCKDFMRLSTSLYGITSLLKIEGAPHAYPVHVLTTVWDETIIILAWFILERLSHEAFLASFSLLKTTLVKWQFKIILCKEYSPEETAYKCVFPNVQVNGTLYSFTQSFMEKVILKMNVMNEPQDIQLLDIVGLCCALPMVPSDFLNEALMIVRREIITEPRYYGLMEILTDVERNNVNNPLRSVSFSVCGSHLRTSNVSECIDISLSKYVTTKYNFYSFIRYLATVAETSGRAITHIEQGLRVRGRASHSLSEDPEIGMLTKSLVHPFLSSSNATLNLLRAVALKQNHVLLRFLRQS